MPKNVFTMLTDKCESKFKLCEINFTLFEKINKTYCEHMHTQKV
jgi:hypothetical protein